MDRRTFLRHTLVWSRWITIAFLALLFFTATYAFYDVKFHRTTGEASWLWSWNRISRQQPVVFFATHDFELSGNDPWVRINIVSDPMYTLFFNEVEVGGGRWEGSESLDVYDVGDLAIAGTNRIVIAVRAPDGAGGLLASVDTGPLQRNVVVTNEDWKITHAWSPVLLKADPKGADSITARVLGPPPFGRWNFPPAVARKRYEAGGYVLHPLAESTTGIILRKIAIRGGVAVAGREDVEARVFDFGNVSGRPRIVVGSGEMRVIRYHAVANLDDLREGAEPFALVMAPGERVVTEPATRAFRFFVALDPIESVEVLSDSP